MTNLIHDLIRTLTVELNLGSMIIYRVMTGKFTLEKFLIYLYDFSLFN